MGSWPSEPRCTPGARAPPAIAGLIAESEDRSVGPQRCPTHSSAPQCLSVTTLREEKRNSIIVCL